jgi:hypothetical protein
MDNINIAIVNDFRTNYTEFSNKVEALKKNTTERDRNTWLKAIVDAACEKLSNGADDIFTSASGLAKALIEKLPDDADGARRYAAETFIKGFNKAQTIYELVVRWANVVMGAVDAFLHDEWELLYAAAKAVHEVANATTIWITAR